MADPDELPEHILQALGLGPDVDLGFDFGMMNHPNINAEEPDELEDPDRHHGTNRRISLGRHYTKAFDTFTQTYSTVPEDLHIPQGTELIFSSRPADDPTLPWDQRKRVKDLYIPNTVKEITIKGVHPLICGKIKFARGSTLKRIKSESFKLAGEEPIDLFFPESVKFFDEGAFHRDSRVKSVTICNPDAIIAPFAFAECINLIKVFFVEVQKGNRNIQKYAFADCPNIERIYAPGVVKIGDYAFRRDPEDKEKDYPIKQAWLEHVEDFGEDCFHRKIIENLTIGEKNVDKVKSSAFATAQIKRRYVQK